MANFLKSLFVKGIEIDPAGATNAQVLSYNGTKFVPAAASGGGGGGASTLDDLTDVVITSPATTQYVRYNGTNFVNATISAGDVPTLNQNTTGNAATVTTNANLTGDVTSVGNATTVVTNANLTGDITSVGNATAIASGVIVNADINASAAIVDTKLATISTALKVSNSATTATSANTFSAIVARDASGNFAAGTITAALTGTASGNLVSGGALGTPSSGTLTNCTFPTLNQSTTGSAATLTNTRTLWGQNFNGSANVSGALTGVGTVALSGATSGTTTVQASAVAGTTTITLPAATGTVALLGTIALGTDTTGNYMSGVTASTGISVTHTPAEGSSATIALANTAVTPASYTNASITVDAQGRLTAASSGASQVTAVTGTSPVVSSGGTTPAISLAASYGDTLNPYAAKTAAFVLAGPTTGTATAPAFRALVATDIPTLNQNTTGNAATVTTNANLTGEVTSSGSNATTVANSAVIAKVLTGYVSGSGTVAATDSILQAVQKLNGNDALKADLASPTFTGTPTLPTGTIATTQTAADSSTKVATTAFVTTADNLKANLASPTFTGVPLSTTAAVDTNTTQIATTAYVVGQGYAKLASPTFTGTPTLPTGTIATTQTAADSSTKVATTAFVTTADNLKANLASPTFTGTVTAPTFSGALTGNVTGNVTGSSGSVLPYAARVSGWTGVGADYDLYVGTTWIYGNTNLQFNSTTRIQLNNNGTSVIGTLGVSGLTTGTYFMSTDATGHFYSTGTYTDLGNSCARVANNSTVWATVVSSRAVYINSAGTLGTTASSRVFKENIVNYHDETNKLLTLNPVTFDFKDGILEEADDRFNHFGLIAEDVHDAGLTHLVIYNEEGNPRAIDYTMISVELLGIVKKQQTAIDDLLARVQALETPS